MDYTSSNAYATDAGTGQRLHQQSAAVTTAVTDQDMNGLIWELMAVIKAAGLVPAAFDKANAATYTQLAQAIQSGKLFSAAAAGTADALTAAFTPGLTALKDGMALYVRAGLANATTTPTFTPNSGTIAAKAIVKGAGAALVAGDIAGAGHWLELQYDVTLDKWVLLNPANGISALSLASFIGTNQSLGNSGYQKLPGGFILQWGSFTQLGTPLPANGFYVAANQSFPIAFPNGCLWMAGSSTLNFVMAQAVALSPSQFTPRFSSNNSGALNVDLQWVAIGR